jgi:hypothetical protein
VYYRVVTQGCAHAIALDDDHGYASVSDYDAMDDPDSDPDSDNDVETGTPVVTPATVANHTEAGRVREGQGHTGGGYRQGQTGTDTGRGREGHREGQGQG